MLLLSLYLAMGAKGDHVRSTFISLGLRMRKKPHREELILSNNLSLSCQELELGECSCPHFHSWRTPAGWRSVQTPTSLPLPWTPVISPQSSQVNLAVHEGRQERYWKRTIGLYKKLYLCWQWVRLVSQIFLGRFICLVLPNGCNCALSWPSEPLLWTSPRNFHFSDTHIIIGIVPLTHSLISSTAYEQRPSLLLMSVFQHFTWSLAPGRCSTCVE